MNPIETHFGRASRGITAALIELEELQKAYNNSDLEYRKARIRAIEAKIDALRAVQTNLNANAYPWNEDEL